MELIVRLRSLAGRRQVQKHSPVGTFLSAIEHRTCGIQYLLLTDPVRECVQGSTGTEESVVILFDDCIGEQLLDRGPDLVGILAGIHGTDDTDGGHDS